jgi:hypothetical protein
LIAAVSAQWGPTRPRDDIIYEHLANGQVRCRLNCQRPTNECPPVNCPVPDQPALNPTCPRPICNAEMQFFLFPTPDPNTYWQCRRSDALGNWEAVLRDCGCMTQFDYNQQRCVHPHEFRIQCNATPIPKPPPRSCPPDCLTCDDNPILTPPATSTILT